jgi:ADP-heptose:LPS heptosyltransferase
LTGPDGILPGARVAVFGRDDERPQALPVLDAIPLQRRIDLVGAVDLVTAYACLKKAAFYVGNDSGLMHLAAAAGVPTLGLFGPTENAHYAPWGRHCAVVRTENSVANIFPPNFDHRRPPNLMLGLGVDKAEEAARTLWADIVVAGS